MGTSKTEFYTTEQNELATIAKALGHPARVAILDVLLAKNSCICNDIVDELPLAQPTISQHLKELKQAGLIQGTISGNSICYCINSDKLNVLINYFNRVIQTIQNQKNCCI